MLETTNAQAFCRKTTCSHCPIDDDGCTVGGQPLIWPGECTSFALTRQASLQVSEADAANIAALAFDAWRSVSCPGTDQPPSILVAEDFGPTSCTLTEYTHTAANANVIAFRDDVWPYADSEDAAVGLTTVSFNSETGDIVDADIEINATANVPLSVTLSDQIPQNQYDLQSILTHEAGHFLGLGHSSDPDAVMRPMYMAGTASLRVPNDDDIAGICAIYPPDRTAQQCNFTPKGGFANECPLSLYQGGCSFARGRTPGGEGALVTLLVAFAVARRRALRQRRALTQGTAVRGRE
jgi:hypothetical protein